MAKSDLDKHLRANPKANRHAAVIKDTLKNLQALQEAGLVGPSGYGLTSPFGGSKAPQGSTRKSLVRGKMTYGA